jgi:lysophospholipid acyltransferase (LPLAT)-like uncharacterized protein
MRQYVKIHWIPFLAFYLGRLLMSTWRVNVVGEERAFDAMRENSCGMILVTWHGRTFVPITRFYRRGYWAMISTSRDGEMQDRIFKRYGFNTVRGSTSARGAVQATLALTKQLKAGAIVTLTPDGPRGPSRCAQPGIIYLAMKSGCPIVPAGISAAPRKLMRSWDRYMLPMPFARVAWIYGEPIYIPKDARSQEDQEHWASVVGKEIDLLEAQADRMVGQAAG